MRTRVASSALSSLLVLVPLAIVACSLEDDKSNDGDDDSSSGAGGTVASGGKGGSANTAGTGTAGKGTAGTGTAGTGTAGTGTAGTGGSGTAGTGTAGTGTAGNGSGGTGTAGTGTAGTGTAGTGTGGTGEGGSGTAGTGTAGSSAAGSPGVSGEWGEVEDPGAGCTVGPMPSFGSLTANAKLPDPFKKMDGTRITNKSEWLCRREEILKQAYEFIYGDKPIPAEGSVSGTVSNTMISVTVSGGMANATFNVTVNMNGATAPAPAIIGYGGLSGMPVPSGVATITFTAIESTGGSGAKNGPFYSYYGSNHEAGYLTAQAWQISRVLDVLEQHPEVIDPHRIGVTGCSRWGKGAFVAGVLDNRIALTIPVESGLGGTVGLRLVETMDSYSGSEWPYHGISYVRWLSETALGQFTTGNSASADNTDKLPVDMHEMMGLVAPRGLYIVDNPSTMYNGLDRNSAWVTANVGKMIFEALGVADNMSYQGAGGTHCSWRSQYTASLTAMIDKFLKGNASAATGNFATDLPSPPSPAGSIDWEAPTLAGEL